MGLVYGGVRPGQIQLVLMMVPAIEAVALICLLLTRRFVPPRLHFHDGLNDAISGTVQTIGMFYGLTVGLIAVESLLAVNFPPLPVKTDSYSLPATHLHFA